MNVRMRMSSRYNHPVFWDILGIFICMMVPWKAILTSIFQHPSPTLLAHCYSRTHTTTRCLSGCATAVFVLKTPQFLDFVDLLWLDMAHLLLSLMAMWSLASATVNDCIESACRGCSGEQCQLCREDTNTVSACVANCTLTLSWTRCFPPALFETCYIYIY